MNPTKKITLLLTVSAAICTLHAEQQNISPAAQSAADRPGVLGQNFAELSFGAEDLRHNSDRIYDATWRGNLPINPNFDFGLGYGYSWFNHNSASHNHLLAADTKFYTQIENHLKPYVGGVVGYQWARTEFDDQFPVIRTHDHRWVWGANAGVEIPVATVALTPHVGYLDTMVKKSIGHYNYGIEANHWFSEGVGGYADVSYNDYRHSKSTWTYLAGIRLRY